MTAIATEREALRAVFQTAARAGRGAAALRLRLADDQIEVTCGGMERSVIVGSVEDAEATEIIVPMDVVGAVDKIGGDTVTIESDGSSVVVASGQTRLSFPLTTNVVPEVPLSGSGFTMLVPGEELQRIASQVAPFASKDSTRPALVAVHFSGESGNVTATDSYRFAILSAEWLDERANALVVPGDVTTAAGVFKGEADIALTINDRVARFESDDVKVTTRQQAADVISWADRVPSWDDAACVAADATALKNAMELVGMSSVDRRAHLIHEPGEGVWVVGATHGGMSKAHVEASGDAPFHVSVNVGLTESVTSRCGSDQVRLSVSDSGPILVRGQGDDWTGGVMPMRCPDAEKESAREAVDVD